LRSSDRRDEQRMLLKFPEINAESRQQKTPLPEGSGVF
jgi:hypothetical protein